MENTLIEEIGKLAIITLNEIRDGIEDIKPKSQRVLMRNKIDKFDQKSNEIFKETIMKKFDEISQWMQKTGKEFKMKKVLGKI